MDKLSTTPPFFSFLSLPRTRFTLPAKPDYHSIKLRAHTPGVPVEPDVPNDPGRRDAQYDNSHFLSFFSPFESHLLILRRLRIRWGEDDAGRGGSRKRDVLWRT